MLCTVVCVDLPTPVAKTNRGSLVHIIIERKRNNTACCVMLCDVVYRPPHPVAKTNRGSSVYIIIIRRSKGGGTQNMCCCGVLCVLVVVRAANIHVDGWAEEDDASPLARAFLAAACRVRASRFVSGLRDRATPTSLQHADTK